MSTPVLGNIDCALLLEIKEEINNVWNDTGSRAAEYVADVEPALAILKNQTARFEVLEQPDKDRELKVWWVDDCDNEDPTPISDLCTIDGDEAGTLCADYALNEGFEKSFSVTEEKFRTSGLTMAQYIAPIMLKKMQLLDEYWAAKALTALQLAAGVNKYAGQYDVVGNKTYIPAPAWNSDVFGYFDTALWMNKLGMSRMISGTLLKQHMWKVGMETTNPNGEAEVAKMTAFGVPYFSRRMDTDLGYKAAFLFNVNSLAMVTKARHEIYGPEGREIKKDGTLWSTIQSKNLPGVVYDLYAQESCVNGDIKHAWKIVTRGGIFQNPTGCDSDLTGVLQFVCGIAP